MAVSTHFDLPFLSKRTPQWLKKMFAAVLKSERNGPVFRFPWILAMQFLIDEEFQVVLRNSKWLASSSTKVLATARRDTLGKDDKLPLRNLYNSQGGMENCVVAESGQRQDFQAPFKDWLSLPWSKQHQKLPHLAGKGEVNDSTSSEQLLKQSPLLPRITMVGIATSEAGHMNKPTLKKTMEDLTKEPERIDQVNQTGSASNGRNVEERDPVFVANVGDYTKTISARLVRREAN